MRLMEYVEEYLEYCRYGNNLNEKTITAYRIDLRQFCGFCSEYGGDTVQTVKDYVKYMHDIYRVKTVKRKIASIKAFFRYMLREGHINENPFDKMELHFKDEKQLPRIVSMPVVEKLLTYMYEEYRHGQMTLWERRFLLRDIVVMELLFSTGLRISELCGMTPECINMADMSILVRGKGAKERIMQVGSSQVADIIRIYMREFENEINAAGYMFVTKNGTRFSEQAARAMIRKYKERIGETGRLTPHMFRHAFATYLMEEDVDIRYIQRMLGHASISTTQIYCYVTMEKQRRILEEKHPRSHMNL